MLHASLFALASLEVEKVCPMRPFWVGLLGLGFRDCSPYATSPSSTAPSFALIPVRITASRTCALVTCA